MKVVPIVLYPILFGAPAAFASSHRIFADRRTLWLIVFYLFLFGSVWIPYIFLPYLKERCTKK